MTQRIAVSFDLSAELRGCLSVTLTINRTTVSAAGRLERKQIIHEPSHEWYEAVEIHL